jgi:hypothetical protein
MFAACANCGERFHMRPGTTAWTCPACGHEHGTATMQDLGDARPERPAQQERRTEELPARHAVTARAAKGPPTRGRLATIAAVGIAAVLVIAFTLSSLGAGANDTVSPSVSGGASPSGAATPSGSSSPVEALCLHLRDLQTLREDALTSLASTLSDDATAIQAEGKQPLAHAVQRMRTAVLAYRDALAAQGDTTQAGIQMANALADLPC